jgi:hypothetical protein
VLLPPFSPLPYLLFRARMPGSLMPDGGVPRHLRAGAVPWIVRNYRWTGLFIPASTHGGCSCGSARCRQDLSRQLALQPARRRSNSRRSITPASTSFRW